jgi:hypothetical protein
VTIITFFKSIEFAIISATISIYFRILVAVKDPTHGPFAIYEPGIANLEVYIALTARTSDIYHFLLDRKYSQTSVDNDKLFEGMTFCVLTIAQPGEPITYFTIPRGILLPINFFNIFDGIECEIYPEGHLKTL